MPARALVVALLLVLLVPARAAAEPSFAQLPGTSGCVEQDTLSFSQCTEYRSLETASSVAISPDGEFAYVSSPIVNSGSDTLDDNADAISIFDRDPATGALTQLVGTAGCVSNNGEVGCVDGLAMDGVRSIAISPDEIGRAHV